MTSLDGRSRESLLARLKFGSAAWHHWRDEEPDVAIDFDGARLDGMILTGINFAGASLRGASLHATNLMNANLRGADLTGANLEESDLIAANLEEAFSRAARCAKRICSARGSTARATRLPTLPARCTFRLLELDEHAC